MSSKARRYIFDSSRRTGFGQYARLVGGDDSSVVDDPRKAHTILSGIAGKTRTFSTACCVQRRLLGKVRFSFSAVTFCIKCVLIFIVFIFRYLFRRALLEDRLAQTNRNSPETCSDSIVNSIALSVEEKSPPASHESPSHSSVSSGDSARSNYGSSKSRSMDFEPSTTKDLDKIGDYIDGVVWENGKQSII